MADMYYVDNVGDHVYVGASTNVYEGKEYLVPSDDDYGDTDYSTLADTEIVMAGLYGDEEETDTLEGMFDAKTAFSNKTPSASVTVIGDWKLSSLTGMFSTWQHKGDKDSDAGKMTDTVTLPLIAATSPASVSTFKKKLDGTRRDRIHCAKTGKGCNKGNEGNAFTAMGKQAGKVGGDMVYLLNTVTRLPETVVKETLGRIPGIGDAIQSAVKLSPNAALGGLSSRVLAGERLDQAFLKTAKEQIKAARDVAPYVQTVMSVVPGVGTGVAAAIAAGTALADGRTITDALLASVKGALPGGPVASMAFDAAQAVIDGKSPEEIALATVRGQLPPAAQKGLDIAIAAARGRNIPEAIARAAISELPPDARRAYDTANRGVRGAMAIAKGKNVKDAILQEVRKSLPEQAKKALDIGVAMGSAKTIQGKVVKKIGTKSVIESIAKKGYGMRKDLPPTFKSASSGLTKQRAAGFDVALAAAAKSGVTAHALAELRSKLKSAQQAGFDHGITTLANAANPHWASVVKNGRVIRGNFRSASANEKGAIKGRMIKGGKVTMGTWVR